MAVEAGPSHREPPVNLEPMYVRYAKEFHVSEQLCESESKLLRRINRFIVYYFGAYLCNVDLEASRCKEEVPGDPPPPPVQSERATEITVEPAAGADTREETREGVAPVRAEVASVNAIALVGPRFSGLQQSRWKRQLKFNWIPQVLLAIFCACEVYLLVVAYHQYSYDFDTLRLRELRLRQTGGSSIGGDASGGNATLRLAETIGSRMAATKVKLDWLGADYSHMTMLAGGFYMCIILLAFLTYLPIYLHHRFQRPFDQCHIVRDLLDQTRENELNVRMVETQVDRFLESSRVYHANLVAFPDTHIGVWQASAKLGVDWVKKLTSAGGGGGRSVEGGVMSRRAGIGAGGRAIPGMVREMLASGALVPLYKLRSWVRKRTLIHFVHHVCMACYTVSFILALDWGFFSLANHERPARSVLMQIACLGPLIIATPTVTLQPPIAMMIAREQIHYVGELRRMIKRCLVENFRIADLIGRRNRLPQLIGGSGGLSGRVAAENQQLVRTMNSNMVFVVLHYKIFVAQLTPMLLTLGVEFVTGLAVLITLPIIVRLHIPYMRQLYEDRLTDAQIRIFAIVISASGLVPINMLTIPICHMYAQCERLYRDLNSLAAHMAEVKSRQGCSDLYDNHVQACLAKELTDSKRLLGRLTPRAGPISGTYKNLVRALFWFGLLLVSIMTDNSNVGTVKRDFLSSLFNDPLGVYNYIWKQA